MSGLLVFLSFNKAVTAGARRAMACAALDIRDRTLRRWTKGGAVQPDHRPLMPRPEPAGKPDAKERAAVPEVCNSTAFANLPASQIVPERAVQGVCQSICPQIHQDADSFPTGEAATRLICLAIRNLEKDGRNVRGKGLRHANSSP